MDEGKSKELSRAQNAAYRYLAVRSRSRKEIEKKLRDRAFPEDIIVSVVEHCMRLGYLDDAGFARQWASARIRLRGFGRRRIEQELRNKGISREIINKTLGAVFEDSSEADIARREAEKKLKSLGRFEPEVRWRRLAGFLERKGYTSEVIHSILRTANR